LAHDLAQPHAIFVHDQAYEVGGDPRSGLMDMVHAKAFWFCRALPGVLAGFAAVRAFSGR
jgi:hypothetical protein